MPQPNGVPYKGPTLYTTQSIRFAIQRSPADYAGVIVERPDDAGPTTPPPPETDTPPAATEQPA